MRVEMTKAVGIPALSISSAFAGETDLAGDPEKGEKVFCKCKACHAVGEDAKAQVGPALNGLAGRAAASEEGYSCSEALRKPGTDGLVWNPEALSALLAKPNAYLDGTKMSFAGQRKEKDRADIIAFLATFKSEEEES